MCQNLQGGDSVASNLSWLFNYETKKSRRFIRQKSPASTTGEQHIGSLTLDRCEKTIGAPGCISFPLRNRGPSDASPQHNRYVMLGWLLPWFT